MSNLLLHHSRSVRAVVPLVFAVLSAGCGTFSKTKTKHTEPTSCQSLVIDAEAFMACAPNSLLTAVDSMRFNDNCLTLYLRGYLSADTPIDLVWNDMVAKSYPAQTVMRLRVSANARRTRKERILVRRYQIEPLANYGRCIVNIADYQRSLDCSLRRPEK
jgi:hypothetical protein